MDSGSIPGKKLSPKEIVDLARETECKSIAYTYTEPTIFFELAYDTAKLALAAGLKNIFVSTGYMTQETLRMLQPYLHAVNIDLKSFDDKRHRRISGAKLQPVLGFDLARKTARDLARSNHSGRSRPQRL